ncbi:MAG: acyloxyacyl hydrolase [Prevotellaceae bacterium]|jgi:hypothetical protein|nr:acyloxyacyl hydrolase [Prevotellaceae bacterium]
MKQLSLIIFCLLAIQLCPAQPRYAVRVSGYGGKILPLSKNIEHTATGIVSGGEVTVDFLPQNNYNWEQFWNYPTCGVGVLMLDMGNAAILGQSLSVYPYLLTPVVKSDYFILNYKVGVGLSFFTKTWNRCDTLSGVNSLTANSAIGSIVNAYITTGAFMEFPIWKGFSATAELGYSHMSNGSILQPNGGLNILYGEVGAKYTFNQEKVSFGLKNPTLHLPYSFALNMTFSGGAREHYHLDNKSYPVFSLHLGYSHVMTDIYTFGGGFDFFYDGAFVQQGTRGEKSYRQHTHYERYFIDTESVSNKFRIGVSLNNAFIIGRVTGILDWGIYLYDPLRNANPQPHKKHGYNRPIIYSYNIDKEDGWNYFRLGVRVRVLDNLYVQAAMKTHLQKAEMVEFGIGYQLPFAKRNQHETLVSKHSYGIYHP